MPVTATLFDLGPVKSPWSHSPMFSAASVDWATPEALYSLLDAEFRFTLDPCPLGGAEWNGLERSWAGHRVFCNPPYGPEIGLWLAKSQESDLAVYLLPARTDVRWFHDNIARASEVRFVKGRVKFGGSKCGAPFPSILLIFGGQS